MAITVAEKVLAAGGMLNLGGLAALGEPIGTGIFLVGVLKAL